MCTQEERKVVIRAFNKGAHLTAQAGRDEYILTREIGKFRITEFSYDRATPRTVLRRTLTGIIELAEDIKPIGNWKVRFNL